LSFFVLFAGCAFSVHAGLNCLPNGTSVDMFAGNYGDFFGYPDEFSDVAVGSRVGPLREVNLLFICTITPGTTHYGTGMKAAPGIEYHAATQTYTTNQLAGLGLGYRMWWHEAKYASNTPEAHSNTNPAQDSVPDHWYEVPFNNGTFDLTLPARVIFFKINDNFQNTNGAHNQLVPSITANLFRFYVGGNPSSPASVAGSTHDYILTLNTFSSVKRVCTPHTNQAITFDYTTTADLENRPVGPVEASTRDFWLTFNCPYMAWYMQGFRMQPVYGVLDVANGVVGIRTVGPDSYAGGVGIQVSVKDVAAGRVPGSLGDVDNYTSPWQVVMPNQNYVIPALQYHESQIHLDPAIAMKSKQVHFRARYYRMPGAITGGKVESAVIFHFVYN